MIDLDAFKRDGFVLVKGLFAGDEVAEVLGDARRAFRHQLRRRGLTQANGDRPAWSDEQLFDLFDRHPEDVIAAGKQVQHLISLHRLGTDERLVGLLGELGLAQPVISTRPVLFFNHRRLAREEVHWRVFAHQDWRSMQGSLDAVVAWLPLVAVDRALGALEIVPGSHRLGLLTEEVVAGFGKTSRFADDDFVAVETQPGDVLLMSSFLAHRSGTNATDHIRWSCHFRFNNLEEPTFVARGFPHPYVYRPTEELLTPDFPRPEDLARIYG